MPDGGGLLRAVCQDPVPVAFDGRSGWLHRAAAGGTGVLMVGAVGFEGLCAHRAWRDLGAGLARAGVPALRLTLPGTGDAPEPDGLPDLVPRWLDAIDAASDWMRHALGLDEVIPCGLHLGALLVAHAASRAGGTGRLALLAPPVSGKQFLRAQKMRAQMARFPATAEPERLEVPALRLHRAAARDIESLSLSDLGCAPARRVLLLTLGGVAEADILARVLTDRGTETRAGTFEGYYALMNDAYLSKRPDAEWRRLVAWIGEDPPEPRRPARPRSPAPALAEGGLAEAGQVEYPVRIPTAQGIALTGVHTGPSRNAPEGVAVVVLNVGANPHAGYGRGAALLCRRLAASGVWSLRFDFAGTGDSDGEEEVDLARLYDPARVAQTRAVLDWLCGRGHNGFVLVGICSGAFQAMLAGLADRRVEGLVLANQLFYGTWRAGGLGGWQRRRDASASRTIRRDGASVLHSTVRRSASGRSLHRHLLRVGLQAGLRLEGLMVEFGRLAGLGTPRRRFRALTARGVRTLVLASENDASLTLLEAHFGAGAQNLVRSKGIELVVTPAFDHALGMAAAQHRLGDEIERFLAASASACFGPPTRHQTLDGELGSAVASRDGVDAS